MAPRPYRLRLVNNTTGEVSEVNGEFEDEESRVLTRFTEYAADLSQARLLESGTGPRSV